MTENRKIELDQLEAQLGKEKEQVAMAETKINNLQERQNFYEQKIVSYKEKQNIFEKYQKFTAAKSKELTTIAKEVETMTERVSEYSRDHVLVRKQIKEKEEIMAQNSAMSGGNPGRQQSNQKELDNLKLQLKNIEKNMQSTTELYHKKVGQMEVILKECNVPNLQGMKDLYANTRREINGLLDKIKVASKESDAYEQKKHPLKEIIANSQKAISALEHKINDIRSSSLTSNPHEPEQPEYQSPRPRPR